MPEKGNELLKRLYLQSGNCADRVSYWPVESHIFNKDGETYARTGL